jgi:hypothetical protein
LLYKKKIAAAPYFWRKKIQIYRQI